MRVLITAPSLEEHDNVSGISTMISHIIENGGPEYVHFAAGRKDGEKFDLNWLLTQAKLPFAFRRAITQAKADAVHINTSFEPRSIIRDLALAKAAGKLPVIVHVHGGRFLMQEFQNPLLASAAEKLLRSAARVIVLSDAEAESLRQRTPGLNVTVLPNAVPTSRFPDGDRQWGEKNILYLGRIAQAKGLSDIVESSRLLREQGFKFRFTAFGTGPDQDLFVKSMTNLLGEKFQYGGVVAGEKKMRALRDADILLMPSKYEGLPLSLLEAMAAGCVPIVSDRGSIPTVVEDGRNGFLVEPGNLTQIVGRLKFLLSEGETEWNRLRRSARQTIVDGYDLSGYTVKLQTIYSEAVRSVASAKR
ncbi:MAG TPA: glycosyltransferase family 4 protein [Pyrinomonadaceae bacterium]|nr:glycosyltransferase family 4 protein [Pyrinomonadaceae bacterium]